MLTRLRILSGMNSLDIARRVQVVSALVEGNSIRGTSRMTGVAKGTILTLLADLGAACAVYLDENIRHLKCKRIQCDEVWAFVHAKDKNLPEHLQNIPGLGSVWTWTAICADCKLIPSFLLGSRDAGCAHELMTDLAGRLDGRVQLTTDGLRSYLEAVEGAFGSEIDYAMLVKLYGEERPGEARYSPAECTGTRIDVIQGEPKPEHIATSFVERQNLTMRMGMRRFTRLTNGFSKKVENLEFAVALHVMHYNFCRVHQTLRVTPAMEAGVSEHVWSMEELVGLVPASVAAPWGTRNGRRLAA